ncbi:MAG: rod shape-determining protein MreC, partial [Bacteroidetes bacterium]|nr:rod shape-determining protein MreC [Bacteroidota bacterium]
KDSIQELQEQLNIGIDSFSRIAIAEPVTYRLIPAKVVQSTYQNRNNLFTLNKGSNDMVTPFSGVISSKGIVGVIKHTSKNYASGLSILHSEQSASVVIDSLKEVGFLQWDFKDHTLAKLEFIPRHVKAKVGQTVSVSHLSYVFPEGTPVGEIVNVQKNEGSAHLDITVKLYEDLRNLKHVYVVKNLGDQEKKELEEKTN